MTRFLIGLIFSFYSVLTFADCIGILKRQLVLEEKYQNKISYPDDYLKMGLSLLREAKTRKFSHQEPVAIKNLKYSLRILSLAVEYCEESLVTEEDFNEVNSFSEYAFPQKRFANPLEAFCFAFLTIAKGPSNGPSCSSLLNKESIRDSSLIQNIQAYTLRKLSEDKAF